MSFDPEKVERFSPSDWTDGNGGSSMRISLKGKFVSYDDYAQLLSLLHEVSTEADPAGTLRKLRLAQETCKALEKQAAELDGALNLAQDQINGLEIRYTNTLHLTSKLDWIDRARLQEERK